MMTHFSPYVRAYEHWAPIIGRVLFGVIFLISAYFKIPNTPGFVMGVSMSAMAGIPLPTIAVALAFLLELTGGIALVVGWYVRIFAFLLALFVLAIALFFFRNLTDQMQLGMFTNCLGLIAGLFYVSVYRTPVVGIAE